MRNNTSEVNKVTHSKAILVLIGSSLVISLGCITHRKQLNVYVDAPVIAGQGLIGEQTRVVSDKATYVMVKDDPILGTEHAILTAADPNHADYFSVLLRVNFFVYKIY